MDPIASNLEDAQKLMSARAATDGDDFRVKIFRRPSQAGQQEAVAIFDGATMEQLLSPEPWLARFAGGSPYYTFRVVHAKDRARDQAIAYYTVPAIPGTPSAPNTKIVTQPGWNGPASLVYPDPADVATPRGTNGVNKWPPTPDSSQGAPRQPAATTADGSGGSSVILAQLQEERARLAEDRHRMEMEALRRAAEEDRKRFEAEVKRVLDEVKSSREIAAARPTTDPTETITKVVTALAAVVAPILPLIAESRRAQREMDTRREEREEKRDEARQARESALMEKVANQSTETAKVISVFTDSLSQTARAMVQTVAMVGELRQPEPVDEGFMGVLKAAIAAWAESQARGGGSFFGPPPSLPSQSAPPIARPSQPSPQSQSQAGVPVETVMTETPTDDAMTPAQMVDVLAGEVREKVDPNDLADAIVEALTAPGFAEIIVGEGGVINALRKRLGEAWGNTQENVAYLQKLLSTVVQIAQSKGVDPRPLFPPQAA